MAKPTVSMNSILDKMNEVDKDYRYMATVDLVSEIQKENFKFESGQEVRICEKVTQLLLEDKSGDIRGITVKCIGPLAKRIQEAQLNKMAERITTCMLNSDKKNEGRDISGMAFKTLIVEIPDERATSLLRQITTILNALQGNSATEVKFDCLDVLAELLFRFGSKIEKEHETIQKTLINQLSSSHSSSRKRAIACLAFLSSSLNDRLFIELIEFIIRSAEKARGETAKTYIQTIGAISRSVGHRLGRFLDKVFPLINNILGDSNFEQDDDIKEICFQTFESVVLRCPKEVIPFIDSIINTSINFIKYDPNVEAQMDIEEEEQIDNEDGLGDDEYDEIEENFSDDEDISWKVRKASAKVLTAIINTKGETLKKLYEKVANDLVVRLYVEREESVKLDFFHCFKELLKQTAIQSKLHSSNIYIDLLKQLLPKLTLAISRQLKDSKSKLIKIKIGLFSIIREICLLQHNLFNDSFAAFVPGFVLCLNDKSGNTNLRLEALTAFRFALISHEPSIFQSFVVQFFPCLIRAASDTYYKVTAEGLRVLTELIKVIRPSVNNNSSNNNNNNNIDNNSFDSFINDIFRINSISLKALDADQEIKESTINCMSTLIAHFGDKLSSELGQVLKILQERLNNEITRLVTVKGFGLIASSNLRIDLSSILVDATNVMASMLRLNNRLIKQTTLTTLNIFVKNYSHVNAFVDKLSIVLTQLAPLINDSDLFLTHLALLLTISILTVKPNYALEIKEKLFTSVTTLLESSLLQGLALESLIELFIVLVKIDAQGFGFNILLNAIQLPINKLLSTPTTPSSSSSSNSNNQQQQSNQLSRQSFISLAQCIAAITLNSQSNNRDSTINNFINNLKSNQRDPIKLLSLYSLGEIATKFDLSSNNELRTVVFSILEQPEETMLPSAASFTLGNIAVGNLANFLPVVLEQIRTTTVKQYLLLHALREVIVRHSVSEQKIQALVPYMNDIIQLLFQNCTCTDDGARTVVAECLGKLALTMPSAIVPKLIQLAADNSSSSRSTAVNAVKFAVIDKSHSIDETLENSIIHFLNLINDSDVNVRRATLMTLNHIIHNKFRIVGSVLKDYLPMLYNETKVKAELIREVMLGPFKHKVDGGLDLRKSAFECMSTLLDVCSTALDLSLFVNHLIEGLKDVHDIRIVAHLMLSRLAPISAVTITDSLDSISRPLIETITTKCKDNAVKQEIDKNEELVRSAIRSVVSISFIPNIDTFSKFEEIVKAINSANQSKYYEEYRAEKKGNNE
eukprot:TRINITY_DN55_c0_g3_i1.p1 TRINITY_DN55_c0_g3~~TRINITY_DN55_c0_g3_i1.p1  ORF type:complete len:1261 (-),score=620.89 TRINITY_DN55_c0_g3_i1:148-3930(-)